MKHASLLWLLLSGLLLSPATAQEPESPPQAREAKAHKPAKRRQGGYVGLFLSEAMVKGQGVVVIDSVFKGSDAEKLGFRAGDQVVSVNGTPIPDGDRFIAQLWMPGHGRGSRRERSTDEIVVRRKGKEVTIKAGLKDLDAHPGVGDKAPLFTLKSADGKTEHVLSRLIGNRPLLLVFGSFT